MPDTIAQHYFGKGNMIEGIVLINLDSRPNRLQRTFGELNQAGLNRLVTRMSAYQHENGMYGCSVSHLQAVRFARMKRWQSVLILEDDIKISPEFDSLAAAALRDLADLTWGVFQFGMMLPNRMTSVTPNLFRYVGGAGAHAVAIHQRAYDHLIEQYECEPDRGYLDPNRHFPFDEYLNNVLSQEFDAYLAAHLLISQHEGHSDTWDGRVDYRELMEEEYESLTGLPRF